MHKRVTYFAILLILLLILLLVLLIAWLTSDSAPWFRPVPAQPRIPSYAGLAYPFLAEQPFPDGKVWLSIYSPGNASHHYLFDLESRRILGELQNATPVFMNRGQTKLLCRQRSAPGALKFRRKLRIFADRVTLHKLPFFRPGYDTETFWVLDLERNQANRIGRLSQMPGSGSVFWPSPDFRYGYNKPSPITQKPELFICDLQKETLTRVKVDGQPITWWDNQSIILKGTNNTFNVYHLPTATVTNLLNPATLFSFLLSLNDRLATAENTTVFPVNTAHGRVLYLTKARNDWPDGESYLARIQKPDATLQLVTTGFKPYVPNRIDLTETWQPYSPSGITNHSNGLFLRNLHTKEIRTLVPDEPTGASPVTAPAFYNDTVIYIRSNLLWQIDLNGSNNTRLFPPP